ncbi:MAG: response regulator, partial [Verrucomicrobia bacterium]|nr:response regulator [Prolixibacteraceae bacterium]
LAESPSKALNGKPQTALGHVAIQVVWIIDDDPTLLEMIASVLRSTGMQVHTFNDPRKALESFKKGCTDLLIMDIQMPGINGVELLKKIQDKNGGPIPAIAVSGMHAGQNASPGFSAFIQKPFLPRTLIDVVSGQQIGVSTVSGRELLANENNNGYNLDQLAAFAAGDPESFREILTSLINTGKENTTLFRQYIEREDKDAISALAHKMLTLFRQMEATDIVELLSRLEQEPKGHDNPQYYLWGKLALDKIEALLGVIEKEEHIAVG